MGKIVFEHKETLFPRLDKNHTEVASEMLIGILQQWPDQKEYLRWRVELRETPGKPTAELTIRAIDPKQASGSDVLSLLFWLFIFGSLIYWLITN